MLVNHLTVEPSILLRDFQIIMNQSTLQIRRSLHLGALVALGALLLTSLGCPRHTPPPDNALEMPEELRVAIDARIATIDDARFRNVVLEYFGDGDRMRVRQLILVQKPDHLRVQTRIPGSDEILNLLVSNGETFSMHQRDTNEYFRGAPTRENINRLLPVDLSSRDVVRVMLGGAPWDRFDEETSTPELEWDRERGLYRYSVQRVTGNDLFMFVRHTDFAVIEVRETSPEGDLVYAYTTEGWRDAGSIALPGYRRFVWPDRDLDFSLDVGDTQLNISLDAHLFELPPPPGSRIIELDD